MLTAKENMRRVILGTGSDRFVNQYEAIKLLPHPAMFTGARPGKGEKDRVNAWGVTFCYPEDNPAPFPVHTPDKIVVKDIARWREYVKAPKLDFTEDMWARCRALYDAVDGEKAFRACMVAPGLFEHCHYLMSMEGALVEFYDHPNEMHELIDYIADWEIEIAKGVCGNLRPDMLFHHDDWGSEKSSFISPEMFAEFFLEPYRRIYGYYKSHGVEFVVHHSDSYAANLVPAMIEMGVDVWQGCMKSNDVPALIEKYGGRMTFMGEIDNKQVDHAGWTKADCEKAVREAVDRCGGNYFIPCITQGGPGSICPGAYMALWDEIDKLNCERFGCDMADIASARMPPAHW